MSESTFLKEHTINTPPKGCPFKVGDIVKFTNDYGVHFDDRLVTGFAKEPFNNRFIHLSKDAYWFPVTEKSLSLMKDQTNKHADILEETDLVTLDNGRYSLLNKELYIQGRMVKITHLLIFANDKKINAYLADHPNEGVIDQKGGFVIFAKLNDRGVKYGH